MGSGFRSPAKVARRLRQFPVVRRHVRNWPLFLVNFSLGRVPRGPYRLRNGVALRISRGVDHAPIFEVVFRNEYGEIPDEAVIVDLGASIGVFAIHAAALSRGARVFAYEPMPASFAVMQSNVELNRLETKIVCVNKAVGGTSDERELYVSGPTFFFPTLVEPSVTRDLVTKTRVSCTTLSDILDAHGLERVDLLKIDVEGGEYEILYSADRATLDRIMEIRMEYHNLDDRTQNMSALAALLEVSGFSITNVIENTPTNGVAWARRVDVRSVTGARP